MDDIRLAMIGTALDFIETHLEDGVSLADVAQAAHYSKYHLHRAFSLSAVSENEMEKSDWLVDPTSDFANVEARLFVESAKEMLSPLEQEIFSSCLLGDMPIRQFAERKGMRKSTAWDMANAIRKKLQEIF